MEAFDPSLLAGLARARDALAEQVTDALLARHPELATRFGDNGVRATRQDVGYTVDALLPALEAGETGLFTTYARWLGSVLRARQVPLGMVEESFAMLAERIEALREGDGGAAGGDTVSPQVARAARQVLEAGSGALTEAGDAIVAREPASLVDAAQVADLLVGGRHGDVAQLLEPLLEGGGYLDVAVNALQPALYEVGRRWQTHRIGVADEHLATSTALHTLTAAFVRAFARVDAAPLNGRRAAFACVEGNLHDLGTRILADAFELAGWEAHALGASTPTRDLIAFVERTEPELVGLSVALPEHIGGARRAIAGLREALGGRAPSIVVGGLTVNRMASAGELFGADAIFADARQALEAA